MKHYLFFAVIIVAFTLLVPLVALPAEGAQVAAPVFSPVEQEHEKTNAEKITVYFHEIQKTEEVNLEEYLVGVIIAEMPAEFQPEALKAQAVAARTYILYKAKQHALFPDAESPHPDADICTDYTHCKAYIDPQIALKNWGEKGEEYLGKVSAAVTETSGQVLVYEDQLINAVFHAISSGKTETSSNIWGSEVPYLVSVSSAGDKLAPGYHTTVTVTNEEFLKILTENGVNDIPKDTEKWIGNMRLSSTGGVLTISLCNQEFTGGQVRTMFSLRSQNFEIEETEDGYIFHVLGYGHGVGMSQYGAQSLAVEGKNYKQILTHYYQGTTLEDYEEITKKS